MFKRKDEDKVLADELRQTLERGSKSASRLMERGYNVEYRLLYGTGTISVKIVKIHEEEI